MNIFSWNNQRKYLNATYSVMQPYFSCILMNPWLTRWRAYIKKTLILMWKYVIFKFLKNDGICISTIFVNSNELMLCLLGKSIWSNPEKGCLVDEYFGTNSTNSINSINSNNSNGLHLTLI